MKYLFGPVPSRRLGKSLGIDPILLKTCNWNCVYCQLGRTVPLSFQRREDIPLEAILVELDEALQSLQPEDVDWITIVGSGEPALYRPLDRLVAGIRARTDLPLAVITNGSLLYLPEVRAALKDVDLVMPSLDAGNADLYKRLNRPHPEASFDRLIDGLVQFRKDFSGKLWLEVMLVAGWNDSEEALQEIAACIQAIRPDVVHLNLPTRPPAEVWVKPPSGDGVRRAIEILGDVAVVVPPQTGDFSLVVNEQLAEQVYSIVSRHPMSEAQILAALHPLDADKDEVIARLETSELLQVVERHGQRFWTARPTHFPATGMGR